MSRRSPRRSGWQTIVPGGLLRQAIKASPLPNELIVALLVGFVAVTVIGIVGETHEWLVHRPFSVNLLSGLDGFRIGIPVASVGFEFVRRRRAIAPWGSSHGDAAVKLFLQSRAVLVGFLDLPPKLAWVADMQARVRPLMGSGMGLRTRSPDTWRWPSNPMGPRRATSR